MMRRVLESDETGESLRRRRTCLLAALVLAAGCRVALDEEHLGGPAGIEGVETHTLCIVEPPAGVTRSGAFSLAFPDGAPQERALTLVFFVNRYGPAIGDRLLDVLPLDTSKHFVIVL